MRPVAYALLLLAGLAAGALTHGRAAPLFGLLTLHIFLPALIFEAAWGLDVHRARANWKPILLLAVPGVVFTTAIIAFVAHVAGLSWQAAFLLGAILSATDPIAVVAIFRRLNVPPALAAIVESESLLNDAMAVVLYRAVLAAAAISAGTGVLFGLAAGVGIAWLASFALRRAVSAPLQSAATLAGAYGVYAVCDRFGWSGIFAVIAFAVALRAFERQRISLECAGGVETFWARAALAANFVLFFFLGSAVDVTGMRSSLPVIGATIGAVILARLFLSYGLLQLAKQYVKPVWMTVVRMAGIRGALSLALALATPALIAERAVIIDATFAVAVLSILVGTLTLRLRLENLEL